MLRSIRFSQRNDCTVVTVAKKIETNCWRCTGVTLIPAVDFPETAFTSVLLDYKSSISFFGYLTECGKWELEKADRMAARLVLSQAGNKYTAAEDKTSHLCSDRDASSVCFLPTFVSILSVTQRGHTHCLATLHHGGIYHFAQRCFIRRPEVAIIFPGRRHTFWAISVKKLQTAIGHFSH